MFTGGDYRFTLRPSVHQSVRQSVRLSVCQLKIFDNLKTIKARRMKLGTWISSNGYNMHAHLHWRLMSQHDLAAKSCPSHNFVIWSLILQLFHRNDHHIKKTCREQHLGRYIEGQGHRMTTKSCPAHYCYLKSHFETIWQKWSLY